MDMVFSILTLIGMGIAAVWGLKWMTRTGQMQIKRAEALTPTDLKVLEESAARLVSDIKAAADECVARVESALNDAERRIQLLESSVSVNQTPYTAPEEPISIIGLSKSAASSSCDIIDSTESSAQVARQSGMTTGEVELLRGLRQISGRS